MTQHRLLVSALVVSALCGNFAIAAAQTVTGTLTHAITGAPIPGAMITAYSARGDTLPVIFGSPAGRFVLPVPDRVAYTLYVRSIGMKPIRIPLGILAPGSDSTLALRMEPVVITFATIRVAEQNDCRVGETGTAHVAELWTEITTSLQSSQLGTKLIPRSFDWRITRTETDVATGAMPLHYGTERKGIRERPFVSIGVKSLLKDGYVVISRGVRTFQAPDEIVFLHESFANSHCFWSATDQSGGGGLLAVNFAPITLSKLNGIKGTFWLNPDTYELISVQFNYTRVIVENAKRPKPPAPKTTKPAAASGSTPPMLPDQMLTPGGELRFRRLTDGVVLVDSWTLWSTDTWLETNIKGTEPLERPRTVSQAGGAILRIDGSDG
jgi:hypothetical protein